VSESWGNDAGVPGFRLGARLRPAPTTTPILRASLPFAPPPQSCRWDATLDLTGEDGAPDALGNDEVGNCVPCAALRQMQLWCGDGRKPTKGQALSLLSAWNGTTSAGTFTDEAFSLWGRHGWQWSEQRKIVPRWTLIEADGINPNLSRVKQAIHALGGVLVVFDMPATAMNYDRWDVDPGSASVGCHAVLIAGYDPLAFWGVSWGRVIPISYPFMVSRLKQASAFSSDAWVRPDGNGGSVTPSGLSADQIRAIGAEVAGV
jgi:hypothetical protein